MQKVPKIIRQIGVDAPDESVTRKVPVLPEIDLPQEKVADGVGAKLVDKLIRVDDVALRFRHLVAVHDEPAVAVDLLGKRQIERHENTRPDDGVKAYDFLAYEMKIGGPVAAEFFRVV